MTLDDFEGWLPGVLSAEQVRYLAQAGHIMNMTEDPRAVDNSAVDLHLTDDGYELQEGSVKPSGKASYLNDLKKHGLVKPHPPELDGTFILERKKTYLFRLNESLNLRKDDYPFYGQATAKSSVGRVDVLARLIVDGSVDYEKFEPHETSEGSGLLYVEITPITFRVRVKPGIALTQLRFFLGDPRKVEIETPELYRTALKGSSRADGTLSVDLHAVDVGGLQASAFSTFVDGSDDPIALWDEEGTTKPQAWKYWRLRKCDERERLRIEKGEFYILRSRERIALPGGVAVYCRASDETIGEMRIHYAGFVHPHFGRNRDDNEIGTPLIFEVRGHDVDVNLLQGERMARLIFYRMSSDAAVGERTKYEKQTLKLSKFFAEWPKRLEWGNEAEGTVRPRGA